MAEFRHIVILTGAGLSAESGISTFRDRDGIWAKYDFSEVATPQGFRANPQLVHDFYNQRRRGLLGVGPNAAHFALARIEREHKGSVTVVTQNIDHLHEEAGARNLIHMHGELLKALCALCGARHRWMEDIGLTTREAGAHTLELNLEPSDGAHLFHEAMHGPATQIVPAYVERLLASR